MGWPFAELGPAKLVPVAIAIAHEHVHEAGAQERTGVHPIIRTGVDPFEELCRRDYFARSAGSGDLRVSLFSLLDDTKDAFELFAELAEGGIVRHDGKRLRVDQHAGRLEQPIGHQRRRREGRADSVLERPGVRGALELGSEQRGGILVDRAELVLASIRSRQAQRCRLVARVRPLGSQPAGEAAEIEDRHPDPGGPQIAIVPTRDRGAESALRVLRSRCHDDEAVGPGRQLG